MSPYVERVPECHVCDPPGREAAPDDRPRRGDVWQCPDCGRMYWCAGWHLFLSGGPLPSWRRIPRARWLSARWVRRVFAVVGDSPS